MTEDKNEVACNMQKEDGSLRLLFATEAYSMGTNAPNIRRIVHVGVPNSMELYLQEVGRAGRDGLHAEAIMFYNSNDIRSNVNEMHAVMREYCKLQTCRRVCIDSHFQLNATANSTEQCCDNNSSPTADCSSITYEKTHLNTDFYNALLHYFNLENELVEVVSNPAIITGLSIEFAHEIASMTKLEDAFKFVEHEEYLKKDYMTNNKEVVLIFL